MASETFDYGLFTQQEQKRPAYEPPNYGSSNIFNPAINAAIDNVTQGRQQNVFEPVAKLIRRKRREDAVKQARMEGHTPEKGESYYARVRDILEENGDMQGAEIAEKRRQAWIDQGLDREKKEVDIADVRSTTEARDAASILDSKKFDLESLKTHADMDNAVRELEILEQNAKNDATRLLYEDRRVKIEQAKLALEQAAAPGERAYTAAQTSQAEAAAERSRRTLESDIDATAADTAYKRATTAGVDLDNEIRSQYGVEEAKLKLEQARQDIYKTMVEADAANDDNVRKSLLEDVTKREMEAKIDFLNSQGQAQSALAGYYSSGGKGQTVNVREPSEADIKGIRKEAGTLLDKAGVTNGSERLLVARAIAWEIERQRKVMGPVYDTMPRQQQVELAFNAIKGNITAKNVAGFSIGSATYDPTAGTIETSTPVNKNPNVIEVDGMTLTIDPPK